MTLVFHRDVLYLGIYFWYDVVRLSLWWQSVVSQTN